MIAAAHGAWRVIEVLLAAGADPTAADGELHLYTVVCNHCSTSSLLLNALLARTGDVSPHTVRVSVTVTCSSEGDTAASSSA